MPIASIVSGLIGQGGAQAAAGKAGQAAGNADFIRQQNQATLSPWFQSGQGAQNIVSQLMGLGSYVPDGQGYGGVRLDDSNWQGDQENAFARFKASPDYNFRLQQGQKALDMSAASRGNLLSGKQVRASQEYGGNLASGEYNNWLGKLTGVGNQGLSAAGTEVQSNLGALKEGNNALLAQGGFEQAGANALASGIGKGFQNALALGTFGLGGGFGGGGGVSPVSPADAMSAYRAAPDWYTRPGMQGL